MSSTEWKNNQHALEEGTAIECPKCGEIILLKEED